MFFLRFHIFNNVEIYYVIYSPFILSSGTSVPSLKVDLAFQTWVHYWKVYFFRTFFQRNYNLL